MLIRRLACSLALTLFLHPSVSAQTPPIEEPTKAEQLEARKALEQKGLTLLDEVVTDAQLLKLPINRLRIQIIAADLIWSRDENRARVLLEKSIKDFSELVSGIDNSDPYYYNFIQGPTQLYNEMLQTALRHDPQLALDLVRHVRLPQPPEDNARPNNLNYELQLESQIASQLAGKDPKKALQIAMESLDKGFSSNIPGLISQLQEKDREGAAKLANTLVKKLLAANLLKNHEAASIAINLLTMASRLEARGSATTGKTSAPVKSSAPLIDSQAYRDLMELVLNAALNSPIAYNIADSGERNIAYTLLIGLQGLMRDVEKVALSRAPQLQRKLADFRKSLDPGSIFWQDNQELFENGSVDDILALASKVTPERRDQVYQQAIWKAQSQGEFDRARQIISENISNPMERRRMLEEIERQVALKASSEGKLDQARQLITRLRSNEDRALGLTLLAGTFANKGDKKTALRLLEEARSLVGNLAENLAQMQAQAQIARAYAPLEPARSFEILEIMVNQFNELLSAAEVLNGFELHYYKDGEFLWQGSNLSNLLFQLINDLGQLGTTDFDRARDIAGRFQRPEARLLAQMSIARAVLSDQSLLNFPVYGRS